MRQTQTGRHGYTPKRDRGQGYERTQNSADFDRLQSLRRAFHEPNAAGVLLLAGVRQSCTGGANICMDHSTQGRKTGRPMSTNGHRSAGIRWQGRRNGLPFFVYTQPYTHTDTQAHADRWPGDQIRHRWHSPAGQSAQTAAGRATRGKSLPNGAKMANCTTAGQNGAKNAPQRDRRHTPAGFSAWIRAAADL